MISRDADRRVTVAGIVVAAVFLAASLASLVPPIGPPATPWLPLHLAMAGGAGVAIGAVLPFFTATLAIAHPADARVRIAVIGLLAASAACVAAELSSGWSGLAVVGGIGYVAGIAGVAVVAFSPIRSAFGQRRPLVVGAYAAALAQVSIGAGLATAFVAGSPAITGAWASLKPAHGWLNVFGFVSVVIVATLVHLGPTVVGARIRPRRSATIAVVALACGPAVIALGHATVVDAVARIGAVAELAGAASLVVTAAQVRRDAAHWTTDLGWHRLTAWSLGAGVAWFALAVAIAAGRTLIMGATPAAWSLETFAVPLVLGWTAQVLVGSWTHLLPAIGAGDQRGHAGARRILGRAAVPRWAGWNAGVAMLAVGSWAHDPRATVVGAALVGTAAAIALVLLLASLVRRFDRRD
jgi:nitrite reductase (NO-forming)